jgi:hypothetical protein
LKKEKKVAAFILGSGTNIEDINNIENQALVKNTNNKTAKKVNTNRYTVGTA